jgi:hypothetical protein
MYLLKKNLKSYKLIIVELNDSIEITGRDNSIWELSKKPIGVSPFYIG